MIGLRMQARREAQEICRRRENSEVREFFLRPKIQIHRPLGRYGIERRRFPSYFRPAGVKENLN